MFGCNKSGSSEEDFDIGACKKTGQSLVKNQLSNSEFEFPIETPSCFKDEVTKLEKKKVPLQVNTPLPYGIEISKEAKISATDSRVKTVFTIKNTSDKLFCFVKANDIDLIDNSGHRKYSDELNYLKGQLFSFTNYDFRTDTCLDSDESRYFSSVTWPKKYNGINDIKRVEISSIEVSNEEKDSALAPTQLKANQIFWTKYGLKIEIENTSREEYSVSSVAEIFDEEGYLVDYYYLDLEFGEESIAPKSKFFLVSHLNSGMPKSYLQLNLNWDPIKNQTIRSSFSRYSNSRYLTDEERYRVDEIKHQQNHAYFMSFQ